LFKILGIWYILSMESKILQKNREELVEICRAMSPEDRLLAFLNHSQLIYQIYEAGVEHRKTPSAPCSKNVPPRIKLNDEN